MPTVQVTLARNKAYVLWPFDHRFMRVFDEQIPYRSRHFYKNGSKYWHINQEWWERAFEIFKSRYGPENIEITGSFEDQEAPTYDEEFPEQELPDDWDFGSEQIWGDGITNLADAYKVLHLLPTADPSDAKVMYKHLSHQNHPDLGGDEETMKSVNRAWEFIEAQS